MSQKKKSIEAKIVKHAHRRRVYDYLREQGRDKFTLSHVYWYMYMRSGKGDVFELADPLAAGDMGIDPSVYRTTRRKLLKDGWMVKNRPNNQGVARWTIATEAKPTGGKATSGKDTSAEATSGFDTTTVVLHLQDADASTSTQAPTEPSYRTPEGVTSTDQVSEQVSGAFSPSQEKDSKPAEFESGKTKAKPTPEDEEVDPIWSEVRQEYIGETRVMKELGECFPAFKNGAKPTREEKRLMADLIARCDDNFVLAKTLMEYARKHKQNAPGLIPRSVSGLHKAVFEGSSTNGLIAQTNEHNPGTCLLCKKELAALPCARCHGSTYGKPTIEHGKPFCGDCMKLPPYRRDSGNRNLLTPTI